MGGINIKCLFFTVSHFWKLWSPRSRFQKIWCLVRALVHRWPSSQWGITWQKCQESSWESLLCACELSHFSPVWLLVTPWTLAHQAPLCMGFSCQEYWSGLLCPPPGDLPYPGIEPASPVSPALQEDSSLAELLGKSLLIPLPSGFRFQHTNFGGSKHSVHNISHGKIPYFCYSN